MCEGSEAGEIVTHLNGGLVDVGFYCPVSLRQFVYDVDGLSKAEGMLPVDPLRAVNGDIDLVLQESRKFRHGMHDHEPMILQRIYGDNRL